MSRTENPQFGALQPGNWLSLKRPMHPSGVLALLIALFFASPLRAQFSSNPSWPVQTTPSQWWQQGLKVGPQYNGPPATQPYAWSHSNSPGINVTTQAGEIETWWTIFNDPLLHQLVAEAQGQNISLRAAYARVQEARSLADATRGTFFPTSFANSAYQRRQFGQNGNEFGNNNAPRAFSLFSKGFSLAWELDIWGKYRRSIEAANAEADRSLAEFHDAKLSVTSETVKAYLEFRGFVEQIRLVEKNVSFQEKLLELTQFRYENDETDRLDVTQLIGSIEETKARIPELRRIAKIASNRLGILTGKPPAFWYEALATPGSISIPTSIVADIPANLLRRRPDIQAAERTVAAESAKIGVAEAALYPALSLTGSIGWQADNLGDLISSSSNAGFITPQFNWEIFDFGRNRAKINAQQARYCEAVATYQQTVLESLAEVEDAMTSFVEYQKQAAILSRGVLASNESVKIATLQYKEGEIDLDRVNFLSIRLVNQQAELESARINAALSVIQLYTALGGGWRVPANSIPSPPPAQQQLSQMNFRSSYLQEVQRNNPARQLASNRYAQQSDHALRHRGTSIPAHEVTYSRTPARIEVKAQEPPFEMLPHKANVDEEKNEVAAPVLLPPERIATVTLLPPVQARNRDLRFDGETPSKPVTAATSSPPNWTRRESKPRSVPTQTIQIRVIGNALNSKSMNVEPNTEVRELMAELVREVESLEFTLFRPSGANKWISTILPAPGSPRWSEIPRTDLRDGDVLRINYAAR